MIRAAFPTAAAAAALAVVALCSGCGAHQAAAQVSASSTPATPVTPTGTAAGSPGPSVTGSPTGSPSGSPTATTVPLAAPVRNGPLMVRPSGGRRTASRATYRWVVEGTPAETYTIAVVQGLSPRAAARTLGRIHRLPDLTGLGALQYVEAHSAATPVPCVVQAGRIGATTVLYQPDGSLASRHVTALGARRMAAYFSTDENWDTTIKVVDRGRLIRTLDPFAALTEAGHDRGALPQEQGLRIGLGSPFAVSWALLERLSLTHLGENWLVDDLHPTYVVDAPHC